MNYDDLKSMYGDILSKIKDADVDSLTYTVISFFTTIKGSQIMIGGLFAVVLSFLLPIYHFILLTICLVIADMITGIIAANKNSEPIKSKSIGRTINKLIVFIILILASRGMSVTFAPQVVQDQMYITWIASGTICYREFKSIDENIEKATGLSLSRLLDYFDKLFNSKSPLQSNENEK